MVFFYRVFLSICLAALIAMPVQAESDKELVKKGIKAFHSQEYKEAISLFGRALASEFNNPKVHYYLANAYAKSGKTEAAIREYRIAHALSPDSEIGKFSKQALDQMTEDFKSAKQEVVEEKKPPPISKSQKELNKAMSKLENQGQKASMHHSSQNEIRASSYRKLSNDVVNRTKIEMLKDMGAIMKRPKLTRSHRRQLQRLREIYQERERNQLRSGNRKASHIRNSSQNLQRLMQAERGKRGHHLQSRGTNLYVRNYGEDN